MRVVAILNPKAGSQKTAHIPASVKILKTEGPGHAIELTTNAIKGGAETIVAVGGDGTINEVVNGFFENDRLISHDVSLAIIPHGTGSDFRRVLNLPFDERNAATLIYDGMPRMLDIMKVRYMQMDGTSALRYSINVTSFGIGGAAASRANRSSKPFGGQIAFIAAALQTALAFSGNSVTLRLDDSKTIEAKITNVAVGNGQYHGAGMWVCPGASLDDGLLDVTVIGYLSLFEMIRDLRYLYNGAIYSHPKAESHRVRRIQADSKEDVLIEVDGEPLGRLPIEISIVPKAIRVLMP